MGGLAPFRRYIKRASRDGMESRCPADPGLRTTLWLRLGAVAFALCTAAPALAQDLSGQDEELAAPYAPPNPSASPTATAAGRVGRTSAGVPGERRTRSETSVIATAKLSSRISNRVQNRIRNRIDRYYDPQANAASPFEAAEDRTRRAGRRPGR